MADNVEMQGIEFQIVNDSAAASAGVEVLAKKLTELKTSISGSTTALSKVAAGISQIKNAVNNMNTGDFANKMNRISDTLSNLKSKTEGLKISSSIANQLTDITAALDNLKWTDGDKLSALADGLRPLSEIGKANLTTFINQLGKLPEVIEDLEKADIDKFTQQMKDLASAMKPFADEMNKVSSGFSAFPSRIQRLITSTEQYNGTVRRATTSTNAWNSALKAISFAAIYRAAAKLLGIAIAKSSQYTEDLNLFTVSMGKYAEEAYNYAQKVSEVMGIDPAEWMRNQGVFNTIISGFGVAGDKAAFMSKNLTQLGYDLASFYNLDFASAMQKVQSGIAGELEPMRRLGYDLSVARLEQERLNLGIDKSVSSMTQAEKSQLRYYAMMTQVTQVQGDMARTLEQPANMLRVLKAQFEQCARAIGNLFIPILVKVLPFAIAVANALREIITAIAGLFGVTLQAPDWGDSFGGATAGSGAIADNMDSAAGSAKELKRYLAGFDELNVLPDQSNGGGGGGAGGGGGGLDSPTPGYDFLENAVTKKIDAWKKKLQPFVDWITSHLKEIGEIAEGIAAIFLAWKISESLIRGVDTLSGFFKNISKVGSLTLGGIGLIADLNEFMKSLKDIQENGANFSNVSKLISEFAGMVGDIAVLGGKYKLGGALKLVQGVGEYASAIKDIADNGTNWENANTAIRGLTNITIGIGVLAGRLDVSGGAMAIQGLSSVITEIAANWEAIKKGDLSGVDKATLLIGAIQIMGGIATALDLFSKLKGISNAGNAAKSVSQTAEAAGNLGESIGGSLSPKMLSLAKNIGLGVGILAEVAAGAIIFVGAIAVLGWELSKVGEAWQPVIDNAGTVTIAVGVGTVLMAAIGVACYALGAAGATVALNVGIGTAILLELGVATALFLAEIWGVGKGLDEIGKAWEPVLNNGEDIATAIGIGTGLLVGIGVVTAALGAATVGTAGLLPLAIGLGTAILVELAGAFILFTESLVAVADELNDNLAPSMRDLNGTLPQLTSDTHDFTVFMTSLASGISNYTDSMGSITWDSIVGGFRKLFVGNPIRDFADNVGAVASDASVLNEKLTTANGELETAVTLLTDYITFMTTMKQLTGDAGTIELSTGIFTNLKDAGSKLVTGFSVGMVAETPKLTAAFNDILAAQNTFANRFLNGWTSLWSSVSISFAGYWNNVLGNMATGLNSIVYATNTIISAVNALMRTIGYTGGISAIPTVSIPRYADGGFVDQGQLFIAREAGAEMVGSIGRRTAIANNDQIVEGITYGVREANDDVVTAIYAVAQQIIAEMRNQDNGGGGGYDFDRAVRDAQRRNARMYG
jgi:hypothetical protein